MYFLNLGEEKINKYYFLIAEIQSLLYLLIPPFKYRIEKISARLQERTLVCRKNNILDECMVFVSNGH
jgi:hypothetical protein